MTLIKDKSRAVIAIGRRRIPVALAQMMIRKIYSGCLALATICALSACGGVQATQTGALALGAPEGDVENTLCGIFHEQNFVGDVASSTSGDPLWITDVQAVEATGWESKRSVAALPPEGETSLLAWTNESLKEAEFKEIAERLAPLESPIEVPAGENVQVGLEGAVKNGVENAEVSQLRVIYKTDLKSSKSFSAVGNIRYEWRAQSCE
ncbi:hypothetical protein ACIOJF_09800 [Glutamicibacter sp. NPDC087831]|uniref:hypothetical protein n=1 Tax=Glutamicibacter sp. NPDC087831 TaxID=3363998 RepID=UPI0038180033